MDNSEKNLSIRENGSRTAQTERGRKVITKLNATIEETNGKQIENKREEETGKEKKTMQNQEEQRWLSDWGRKNGERDLKEEEVWRDRWEGERMQGR